MLDRRRKTKAKQWDVIAQRLSEVKRYDESLSTSYAAPAFADVSDAKGKGQRSLTPLTPAYARHPRVHPLHNGQAADTTA